MFDELELIKQNDWKPVVKEVKEEKKIPKRVVKKPLVNYAKVKPTFRRPQTQPMKPVNK